LASQDAPRAVRTVVHAVGEAPPVRFAAAELRKYLSLATGRPAVARFRRRYRPSEAGLWVGTFADFGEEAPRPASDDPLDDEIFLRVGAKGGIVAGANPRSALLAAYRYLTVLGFRWVRPGRDGERVPRLRSPFRPLERHERPAFRHRAVCIEGACAWEHVRDMIAWMPKVGLNAYFLQLADGYEFFERWYRHPLNPLRRPERFSKAWVESLRARLVAQLRKRGLLLHNVGHGWTCEAVGLHAEGWHRFEGELSPPLRRFLAMTGGRRRFFNGRPLNTQLCYGNPKVRERLTDLVANYAEAHPEVDLLHFWLADGSKNFCECVRCRKYRPADLYVKMLNRLDEKLSARGLPTRIVFLVYVDLLWPPVRERLKNPERFVLMFAPITRSYLKPLPTTTGGMKVPPFRLNRLKFPSDPKANLAFLAAWQRALARGGGRGCDSFDFDYHFWWAHFRDPGNMRLARVVHDDVRHLARIGLQGLVNCQLQRIFWPTGFAMTAMAATLWDRDVSFDAVAEDYFRSAFGAAGERVRRYLERLSEAMPIELLLHGTDRRRAAAIERLRGAAAVIEAFRLHMKRGCRSRDALRRTSWRILSEHAEICRRLAEALVLCRSGDEEAGRESAWSLIQRERNLHRVLDVWMLVRVIGILCRIPRAELERPGPTPAT